jgi:hypothetical protein
MIMIIFPRDYIKTGDIVLWPNGVEGVVMGVDHDDATLLDHCGAWIAIDDVDLIKQGADA